MNLLCSVWRRRWLGLFRCRFRWFDGRGRRSRLHNSCNGWRRCRAEILLDLGVERFSGICLQCLLLLRERHWRWRRCHPGHYRPAGYRGRGLRRSTQTCGFRHTRATRSHHACFHGNHRSGVNHGSGRARSNFHRCLCHRLSVHESCLGHSGNGTRHSLVDIRRCLNVVVNYICNYSLLDHSIRHIHLGYVCRACLLRRHVHFTRRQRKPPNSACISGISR
jgi:hypothetical protein